MACLAFPAISQPQIDFPQALTEKYRPQTVDAFVGLDKAKKIMGNLAARPFASAWLFVGPSGTGKSTMALALADAIGAQLHHIPSQSCNVAAIEELKRHCSYAPMFGTRFHLVLVDEADRMSDAAQVALLSVLDATNPLPDTIFIFTCNGTERLEPRFLSRLRTIEFSSYGISKEAADLLAGIWTKESNGGEAPNFQRIVKDASNNIRAALMALETELMANGD